MLLILYTLAFMLQLRVTIVITTITFENALASCFTCMHSAYYSHHYTVK